MRVTVPTVRSRGQVVPYITTMSKTLFKKNFFSVLLAVLRYCPGSTVPRCPPILCHLHNGINKEMQYTHLLMQPTILYV